MVLPTQAIVELLQVTSTLWKWMPLLKFLIESDTTTWSFVEDLSWSARQPTGFQIAFPSKVYKLGQQNHHSQHPTPTLQASTLLSLALQ
jgi:hypothetical protein